LLFQQFLNMLKTAMSQRALFPQYINKTIFATQDHYYRTLLKWSPDL